MRILFKILLFPVSLVLTVFVALSGFLIERMVILLNIFSGIMFLSALAAYAQYFLGWPFDRMGDTPNFTACDFRNSIRIFTLTLWAANFHTLAGGQVRQSELLGKIYINNYIKIHGEKLSRPCILF